MHKVHVADSGDDERFVGRGRETLDYTCGEEFFVGVCALADCCADDSEETGDQEDGTFAVFSGDGTVEWSRIRTDSEARDSNERGDRQPRDMRDCSRGERMLPGSTDSQKIISRNNNNIRNTPL